MSRGLAAFYIPTINGLEKVVRYCDVEKELKALEIIKPFLKEIIGINKYDKDFFECFIQIENKRKPISKETYDLLNEVLL